MSQIVTRLAITLVGVLGVFKSIQHFRKKKLFISFAVEDEKYRNLLVWQSKNSKTPFEFIDKSIKEPFSNAWKTRCGEVISSCDGVLVLISDNTLKADGVHWEVKYAKRAGIPIMAMYARNTKKAKKMPDELKGVYVYKWSWNNIYKFVEKIKNKEKLYG